MIYTLDFGIFIHLLFFHGKHHDKVKSMKTFKKIWIVLFVCILAHTNVACGGGYDKKGARLGVTTTILNRIIAKFIFGEVMGIPRDASPCNPEITIKEAFDQPCKLFKLSMNTFTEFVALMDVEFYSLEAKELFAHDIKFKSFMYEIIEKINDREEKLELGEFAFRKNREFVLNRSKVYEVDSYNPISGLITRFAPKIRFYHPNQVQVWRKPHG
jgi:hypothetical protein